MTLFLQDNLKYSYYPVVNLQKMLYYLSMNVYHNLRKFGAIPFSHSVLLGILTDYKNPNDKIQRMVEKGELISLKRGLYLVGDNWREAAFSYELLANAIYAPSYISLSWALSKYQLIPEQVHEVTSISYKRSQRVENKIGRFSYIQSKSSLFSIGLNIMSEDSKTNFRIASKEKALCDMIIYSKGLTLRSLKEMQEYLGENLRIDPEDLIDFDTAIIQACIDCGYKKTSLYYLLSYIDALQEGL